MARDRRKTFEKEKEKQKNEIKSNNNNKYFFYSYSFILKKIIFCSETYLKKLNLYSYICIRIFSRERCSNKTQTHV